MDPAEPPQPSPRPQLRQPHRNVLADEVYQILKDGLLSRRIQPGARMNLDQLARELHVSSTPIRQALGRLESDGLVSKEPYRGFSASRLLDSHSIAELYDFRMMIEPPMAARAAKRRGVAGLAALESLCDPQVVDSLLGDPAAVQAIADRDSDLHTSIAREGGNSVVTENLAAVLSRSYLYNALYNQREAAEQAWTEHRAIVAAIRAGDPSAAAEAMTIHLSKSLERFREAVN